jgi:hypothetical protein
MIAMNKLTTIAVVCMLCGSAAYAQAPTMICQEIVMAHGFLSRAQAECDIAYYSQDMMGAAGRCYQILSRAERSNAFNRGIDLFDDYKRQKGQTRLCAWVRAQFPQILK